MDFINQYLNEFIAAVSIALISATIAFFRKAIVSHYLMFREKYFSSDSRFKDIEGRIIKPENNSKVDRHIDISGSHAHLKSHAALWIFVDIDGSIWPKNIVKMNDAQSWSTCIQENGIPDGGRLKLLLVCANKYGNSKIDAYQKDCLVKNSYPGTHGFPGTKVLHEVSITV